MKCTYPTWTLGYVRKNASYVEFFSPLNFILMSAPHFIRGIKITYHWLSNQLSVSSNVAKQYPPLPRILNPPRAAKANSPYQPRMLHAFVAKKGEEVQTIYLISGDRKGHGHTVMLVGQAKLAGNVAFAFCNKVYET